MNRYAAVLTIVALCATAPAGATVVTFDDAAGQAQTGGYQPGESFTDQGLTFTYSPAGSAFMQLWDASGFGAAPGSNGTNTLLVGATRSDVVTITQAGGGLFSLASLLLGISEPAQSQTSDAVLINGISTNITSTATNYAFNLTNVSSVTISGLVGGGYVSVDNVNYQVPEPASIIALGTGLVGLTLARRRRGKPSKV